MGFLKFYLFLAVTCSSIIIGQGDVTTTKPRTIDLEAASYNPPSVTTPNSLLDAAPSVNAEPTHNSALPSVKTDTAAPTTSTTTTPAPTTPHAPTTTPSPTTTPAPTTEPSPQPTPAPEPKPTPAPGPLPAPTQGTWFYTDKSTNITCILVQFAAQLNITYPKNNTSSLGHVLLNVPANATVVDGNCNATSQSIQLAWPESRNYTMLLHFTANTTSKSYMLHSLNISLTPEILVNSSHTSPVELWHGAEWPLPLETSYRCAPSTQLNLTADITNLAATISLAQLQEEAFRTANNTKTFSAARECGGADLPDAVPIAVGCALGGLVVVVLIAYLEGRRRSAARGYLSM